VETTINETHYGHRMSMVHRLAQPDKETIAGKLAQGIVLTRKYIQNTEKK